MIFQNIKTKHNIIIGVITFLLTIIPSLFWGNLYIIGGDDSRIYYIYPFEFLTNFALKITPDNTLGTIAGYYPKSFWAPLVFLILILKNVPYINVQMLMFGLNLGFGFLSFYLFLSLWIKSKNKINTTIKILSALFYVFSTYLIKTLYENQLISIYLVSVMPITLYLFIKGISEKKSVWIVLSVSVYSLFSSTFTTFTWSIGLLLTLLPVFIYIFIKETKTFIKYSLVFAILFLMLNAYWMFHHFYSFFDKSANFASFYSSDEFKSSNHFLISQVYSIFSPLNRVLNERDSLLLTNYSIFTTLKIIFLFIIVVAGVIQTKTKKDKSILYLLSLGCLVLSFFFFQPNLGDWSLRLFIFLNDNVPFFSMFRNMSDKFSLAMSFNFAFAFGISFYILCDWIKRNKIITPIMIAVLFVTIINGKSFILPTYNDSEFSIRSTGILNKDFLDLVYFIRKNTNPTSKFMWVPLNYPGYLHIEDEHLNNHFYFGPSLLSILAQRSDYAGYLSFGTVYDPDKGGKVFDDIRSKNYIDLGKKLQEVNVNYLIEYKFDMPLSAKAYLYSEDMLEIQNEEFKRFILGEKIKDFGYRYTLYKIRDDYSSEKVYLSNNKTPIFLNKINDVDYDLNVYGLKGKSYLIFQEQYNKGWTIYLKNSDSMKKTDFNQIGSGNTAIKWMLDEKYIINNFPKDFYKINPNGGLDVKLKIYYEPQNVTYLGQIVSLSTLFFILIIFLRTLISKK